MTILVLQSIFGFLKLHGTISIAIPCGTLEAEFLVNVLISEKRGGADFFHGFVWRVVWAESLVQI
jgi:hypothetical protein